MKYEPDFSWRLGDARDEPSRHERRGVAFRDSPPKLVGDDVRRLILFSEALVRVSRACCPNDHSANGARVCDPQQLELSENRSSYPGIARLDYVAAGRRPALRGLGNTPSHHLLRFMGSRCDIGFGEFSR